MENQNFIESGEKRAKVAIIFILLTVASYALWSVLVKAVGDWVDAEIYEYEETWTMNHTLMILLFVVSIGMIFASIISIVTFIMWFWRGYDNLKKLGSQGIDSKVMTVVCWFIPLANIYMPYMYMRDMFRHANKLLAMNEQIMAKPLAVSYVIIWWLIFLVSGILSSITGLIEDTSTALNAVPGELLLIENVFFIVLAFFTIRMIRAYVAVENKLIEAHASAENIEENVN